MNESKDANLIGLLSGAILLAYIAVVYATGINISKEHPLLSAVVAIIVIALFLMALLKVKPPEPEKETKREKLKWKIIGSISFILIVVLAFVDPLKIDEFLGKSDVILYISVWGLILVVAYIIIMVIMLIVTTVLELVFFGPDPEKREPNCI